MVQGVNVMELCSLFLFHGVIVTAQGILGVNIALKKPAYQSSTHKLHSCRASNAVDGGVFNKFFHKSCTHTRGDETSTPWWEVDLQDQFRIGSVHVLNRINLAYRLHDIRVDVYENKAKPRKEKHCITHPGPAGPGWLNLSCKVPVLGRYVRIIKPKKDRYDVLTLCEVEIYQAREKLAGSLSYLNCCKMCG